MISREFILAGRAIFTVAKEAGIISRSGSSAAEHYTFRICKGNQIWFADFLSGPDNTRSYLKLCRVSQEGICTIPTGPKKTMLTLQWALRKIWNQENPPTGYSILHAGRCGRCGRLLTTPESIEAGIGPECQKKSCQYNI